MSTERRSVLFTTGIRSEYDILYPVVKAVEAHPKLEARMIVTGAHLTEFYGHTASLIEEDGIEVVAKIESLLTSDTRLGRVKSAAIQLMSIVDVFTHIGPDIVVAMGDREEALTVAMAGAYMGIPTAHIGGGDYADDGNIDNSVRHAVTRLAHVHLVTTERSAKRLGQMGEEAWRIHVVGAPGLDRILTTPVIPKQELEKYLRFELTEEPLILVIQHPISTEIDQAAEQMKTTLEAIAPLGLQTVVIHPNSDAGNRRMVEVIQDFSRRYGYLHPYRTLRREIFVNLMRLAGVLVGNSSCGIIEAPLLKLPAVNIGRRQTGREHAENVIFTPHDKSAISEAIQTALHDEDFRHRVENCQNPYGDGQAGERIARLLADLELDESLVGKRFAY